MEKDDKNPTHKLLNRCATCGKAVLLHKYCIACKERKRHGVGLLRRS